MNGSTNNGFSRQYGGGSSQQQQNQVFRYRLLITLSLCFVSYILAKITSKSTSSVDYENREEILFRKERNKTITKVIQRHTNYTAIDGEDTSYISPTFWLEKSSSSQFNPKIVWLMSFPNSGTSFTMTLTKKVSNTSVATNYADEVTPKGDPSLSIYPLHDEGPFWDGMTGKMMQPRPLPSKYILTKTHCGSRCINCGPSKYIQTKDEFLKDCCEGYGRVKHKGDSKMNREPVWYPADRVHKAIHLIRNPLHNIIARFHLDRKNKNYSGKDDWLEKHPNDADGFLQWCAEMDKRSHKDDKSTFTKELYDILKQVPCHGEFYRFTQWHNLAFEVIHSRNLPTLLIHYEDYITKFNETVDNILTFLHLDDAGNETREFTARSDYDHYYTSDQKSKIATMMEKIASKDTWEQVKHYFD